jgi:hypothetical protein
LTGRGAGGEKAVIYLLVYEQQVAEGLHVGAPRFFAHNGPMENRLHFPRIPDVEHRKALCLPNIRVPVHHHQLGTVRATALVGITNIFEPAKTRSG